METVLSQNYFIFQNKIYQPQKESQWALQSLEL